MTAGTTAPPTTRSGAWFPCLDAYRGIGMLMVLGAHASFATGYAGHGVAAPYLSRLELAVPMFFMLSGFLLYRPYAASVLDGRPPMTPLRFLRRRGLRLAPAYWSALILIVALYGRGVGPTRIDSPWDWITNLLVLQQFGVDAPLRITQAWSIGVEASFYLMLPVYAVVVGYLLRRFASTPAEILRTLLVAAGGLYVAGWVFRIAVVATAPAADVATIHDWQVRALGWLPMYIDFFALGMMLAIWSVGAAGSPSALPSALRWFGAHPAWSWTIAGAVFIGVAQMEPPATPFGLNGTEYLPRQLAYGLGSVAWLAPAMFGDQSRGRLRAMLASPVMVWLGAISLSFYLWHLEMIEQAKEWTVTGYRRLATAVAAGDLNGIVLFQGNVLGVLLVAGLVTAVVAWISYRLIERPFVQLKDRPLTDLPTVYREELRL